MHLSGYSLIIQRYTCLAFFRLIHEILRVFQTIKWSLDGTQRAVKEMARPENYDRSVRVMNVMKCYRFDDVIGVIDLNDFLLTHDRFTSPEYVFENDHVTLMTVTDEAAVFCEASPGEELWRSEFAFLRLAQISHCRRVLTVPLSVFHHMSERLGDPRRPLVYVVNTSRCGSTLLLQMMEATGKCVTISEPDVLNTLAEWYCRRGDSNQLRETTRDCFRWICRPYATIDPSVYIVKVMAGGIVGLRLFHDVIPGRCLFMYRNIEKTAKSILRLAQELPMNKIAILKGKLSPNYLPFRLRNYKHAQVCNMKLEDDIDYGILRWIVGCLEYIDLRQSDFPIDAVRYEDITQNSHKALESILSYCGLPVKLVDLALTGLEQDSQRNSPHSATLLRRHRDPVMTDRARVKFNKLLHECQLPLIEDEAVLEGTITHNH